jgi:hypothetical protein
VLPEISRESAETRSEDGGPPIAARTCVEYTSCMVDFFRTERGQTLRMEESDDGLPRVDLLKQGSWVSAPRGMFGLRLSKGTRRLTPAEILRLPV